MFSLLELAANKIPSGKTLPEVIFNDIINKVKNKLLEINKNILKEDDKYMKTFINYTNILNPKCDIGSNYAESYGQECLYDILDNLSTNYKLIYVSLPDNYDESSDWFVYLEFMYFRIFTHPTSWIFDSSDTNNENNTLIFLVRGIIQTFNEVKVPEDIIPEELTDLNTILNAYIQHMRNFEHFYNKKYSYKIVYNTQKKYVHVYEEREKIKNELKNSKKIYEQIKDNLYT